MIIDDWSIVKSAHAKEITRCLIQNESFWTFIAQPPLITWLGIAWLGTPAIEICATISLTSGLIIISSTLRTTQSNNGQDIFFDDTRLQLFYSESIAGSGYDVCASETPPRQLKNSASHMSSSSPAPAHPWTCTGLGWAISRMVNVLLWRRCSRSKSLKLSCSIAY